MSTYIVWIILILLNMQFSIWVYVISYRQIIFVYWSIFSAELLKWKALRPLTLKMKRHAYRLLSNEFICWSYNHIWNVHVHVFSLKHINFKRSGMNGMEFGVGLNHQKGRIFIVNGTVYKYTDRHTSTAKM